MGKSRPGGHLVTGSAVDSIPPVRGAAPEKLDVADKRHCRSADRRLRQGASAKTETAPNELGAALTLGPGRFLGGSASPNLKKCSRSGRSKSVRWRTECNEYYILRTR
jgi:hypothetical protein